MKGKKQIKTLIAYLNNLKFKTDFKKEDKAFISSPNSIGILTYIEESFFNTKTILHETDIFESYVILKIKSYIELEFKYSQIGYKNTANIELANFDISSEIKQELEPIEELCLKYPNLVTKYQPHLKSKNTLYFTKPEESLLIDLDLNKFDLDINSFIETEA